jgi:ABC-type polysaccharide/polyol phosphate transport system ATPase subunit
VKAFNTVVAQVLGGTGKAQVFFAGDDAGAKDPVRALIESAGLEAADAGPLANAVSLTVRSGRCVALVGESGAGRTTLLRRFNRMVAPAAGEVRVVRLSVPYFGHRRAGWPARAA